MIQELTKNELLTTNGGNTEVTPENIGYEVGHWVGKALIVWATFFKK